VGRVGRPQFSQDQKSVKFSVHLCEPRLKLGDVKIEKQLLLFLFFAEKKEAPPRLLFFFLLLFFCLEAKLGIELWRALRPEQVEEDQRRIGNWWRLFLIGWRSRTIGNESLEPCKPRRKKLKLGQN